MHVLLASLSLLSLSTACLPVQHSAFTHTPFCSVCCDSLYRLCEHYEHPFETRKTTCPLPFCWKRKHSISSHSVPFPLPCSGRLGCSVDKFLHAVILSSDMPAIYHLFYLSFVMSPLRSSPAAAWAEKTTSLSLFV